MPFKTSRMKDQRKTKRNEELRRLYPPYYSSSNLEIIQVHHRSTIQTVEDLIKKATKTRKYVMDTESQFEIFRKGEPRMNGALIQIQMIHSTTNSTVMLIETYHLPDTKSSLYKKIEELCSTILNNNNEIITWGPIEQEFATFHHLNLIHLGSIRKCDLQFYFSNPNQIYNMHPEMESRVKTGDVLMEIDTYGDELIVFADDDDWIFDNDYGDVQQKEKFNPPLALQAAVAENFHKFLDKSDTNNDWNCGLDLNLDTWRRQRFSKGNYDEYKEKQEQRKMLQYAVDDCTSVAELYFHKYPEMINDYLTPLESPAATTTIVQIPPVDEVFTPDEQETTQQLQQDQGKPLTKREIFLYRQDVLDKMDENQLIEFQRPVFDIEKQARRTAEEELQKKKKNNEEKMKNSRRKNGIDRILVIQ